MSSPPKFYEQAKRSYPQVIQAYEALDAATRSAGPLGVKCTALVKLALSLGAGLEGAAHAATRKALAAGCSPDEVRHVALLSTTTLGFPSMMRARAWIEDVLSKD